MYLMLLDESYYLDDKSNNDGSNSGSSGTYSFCAFYLRFDIYFVSISSLGSGVFIPAGVKSKCDSFAFVVFVPIGVKSKVGRPIEIFWRSNSLFYFQILKSVL